MRCRRGRLDTIKPRNSRAIILYENFQAAYRACLYGQRALLALSKLALLAAIAADISLSTFVVISKVTSMKGSIQDAVKESGERTR